MSQISEDNKKDTFVTGVEIEGKDQSKQSTIAKPRIQTAKIKVELQHEQFTDRKSDFKHVTYII